MLKKCVMCGKEFETKGSAICCSEECRRRKRKRGSNKKEQIESKNIAQVNALARKAGLSYGAYVARCNNA